MDKNKVYWIWQDGNQYQVSWCDYTQQWSMIQNSSGRAFQEQVMNIEVISVDEETGHVELELDEEARAWLIEVGFNKILRDAIEAIDERNN